MLEYLTAEYPDTNTSNQNQVQVGSDNFHGGQILQLVHQQNSTQNEGFIETFGMPDKTEDSSDIQMDSNESNVSQQPGGPEIEIQDQNQFTEEQELISH